MTEPTDSNGVTEEVAPIQPGTAVFAPVTQRRRRGRPKAPPSLIARLNRLGLWTKIVAVTGGLALFAGAVSNGKQVATEVKSGVEWLYDVPFPEPTNTPTPLPPSDTHETGFIRPIEVTMPYATEGDVFKDWEITPDPEVTDDQLDYEGFVVSYKVNFVGEASNVITVKWTLMDSITKRPVEGYRRIEAWPQNEWSTDHPVSDIGTGDIWIPFVRDGIFEVLVELFDESGRIDYAYVTHGTSQRLFVTDNQLSFES